MILTYMTGWTLRHLQIFMSLGGWFNIFSLSDTSRISILFASSDASIFVWQALWTCAKRDRRFALMPDFPSGLTEVSHCHEWLQISRNCTFDCLQCRVCRRWSSNPHLGRIDLSHSEQQDAGVQGKWSLKKLQGPINPVSLCWVHSSCSRNVWWRRWGICPPALPTSAKY